MCSLCLASCNDCDVIRISLSWGHGKIHFFEMLMDRDINVCLSVCQPLDVWMILRMILLWKFTYMFLYGLFSNSLRYRPRCGISGACGDYLSLFVDLRNYFSRSYTISQGWWLIHSLLEGQSPCWPLLKLHLAQNYPGLHSSLIGV